MSVSDDEMQLVVEVNTCNQSSTEVAVSESDDLVVVTASTGLSLSCGGDDCSDGRTVDLSEPVGDRRIVDGDGEEVRRSDG